MRILICIKWAEFLNIFNDFEFLKGFAPSRYFLCVREKVHAAEPFCQSPVPLRLRLLLGSRKGMNLQVLIG
jgi:hypothetical protein